MRHRRIQIIGSPGSGKSWLASKLGAVTGLPVLDLDGMCWDVSSGRWGVARAPAERASALERVVAQEAWIVHGTDVDWTAPALAAADMVVLLTAPVWLRDLRLLSRWLARAVRRREPAGMTLAQLGELLRRGHRYAAHELDHARGPLREAQRRLVHCDSSEDVRQVLEDVLGLHNRRVAADGGARP
jgi:adenylate kinase family enzyme